MIRRITLENYMSHALTVIEPADGLTVLIGPNNCGKSAVVSALQSVCGDNDGGFMMRHGEKVCRVTIETAEGDTITWQRKGKVPSYVLNGTEIHRVGRGALPDDLQKLLKLPDVESADGKKSFPVHFGSQKLPIFLLDSESDMATFFSSSAESERLLEMQRRHKLNAQRKRTEHKNVEDDLVQLAEKLLSLSPLEELQPQVETLETNHRALDEQLSQIAAMADRIERIAAGEQRIRHFEAQYSASNDLRTPPLVNDLAPTERLIVGIEKCAAELLRFDAAARALVNLRDVPTLPEDKSLEDVCRRISAFDVALAAETRRVVVLNDLREAPVPIDAKPLTELGQRLAAQAKSVNSFAARVAAMETLPEPPELLEVLPLNQFIDRAGRATKDIDGYLKDFEAIESSFASIERELIAWVTQNPTCPVCGADVERDRMLAAGGHRHA